MPIEKYINFKIEWLKKHPTKNWDFNSISKHKDFKFEWVEKYPTKNWDFEYLSKHKDFKIKWVEKFPLKNWDFNSISKHKDFKIEWIEKFPYKDWNLEKINIYKHIDEYYDTIYENCVREYMAAYKIQQWWFKITMSPHYKIGRKFINRSYQKLCYE